MIEYFLSVAVRIVAKSTTLHSLGRTFGFTAVHHPPVLVEVCFESGNTVEQEEKEAGPKNHIGVDLGNNVSLCTFNCPCNRDRWRAERTTGRKVEGVEEQEEDEWDEEVEEEGEEEEEGDAG